MKTSSSIESSVSRRVARFSFRALVACCLVLIFAGASFAQEYKEATVDESLANQRDSILASGNADNVKDFLKKYYLARWTVRANARDLGKYRQELEADSSRLSGAAKETFLKEVADLLKTYAGTKSCYPGCRFNAVLALGNLNETAGDRNGAGAVPYAGAITTLGQIVSSEKDVPDYVRLGALIGLVRHAELGIKDEKAVSSVKNLFVKVLDPTYATSRNIRDDVYEWFQEKALQGLASFKSPEGTQGGSGTLDLFKRIIDDPKQNFELRCLAARAIGDMNLDSLKNYDYMELSKSLITLARDFCVDETTYINDELVRDAVKTSANTMGGGGLGGMSGGMGGGPGGGIDTMGGGLGGGMGGGMGGQIQNQKSLEAIVARIQYGFECIQRAVKGVKNGGSGIREKLSDEGAQKEMKDKLGQLLEEFTEMNEFIKNGPKNGGGMGMDLTPTYGGGNSTMAVDANSMKDHLLEKKIKFNELLGVDSY